MKSVKFLEGDSLFAFDSDVSINGGGVEDYSHVTSNDADNLGVARDVLFSTDVFDGSRARQQFLKQYSSSLVKEFFLSAENMTLGNLILKAHKLGCNMSKEEISKVGNILASIPSSAPAVQEWIKTVDLNSKFRDGWHGNHITLSTLFKLNGLNWHWKNGSSSEWDKHPIAEVESHLSATHSLFGASDAVVRSILLNYSAIMLYGKVKNTDDLIVHGLAGAFNGETSGGDFSLFNSMLNQNLSFRNPNTTEYAYGLQQRLNSRILYLLFFTAKRFANMNIDIFKVPFVVCSSPQISAECEHSYMNQDSAKDCLPQYIAYAKQGYPLSLSLPQWMARGMKRKTWIFPASTTAKQRAVGAALIFVQGIRPNDAENFGYISKSKKWFNK